MLKDLTFAALAHLLVSLCIVVAVILLAAWSKISGDTAIITILAVAGISAPAQMLTSATVVKAE